jgi:hypothetical protein
MATIDNKEIKHEHDPNHVGLGLVQLIVLAISFWYLESLICDISPLSKDD